MIVNQVMFFFTDITKVFPSWHLGCLQALLGVYIYSKMKNTSANSGNININKLVLQYMEKFLVLFVFCYAPNAWHMLLRSCLFLVLQSL